MLRNRHLCSRPRSALKHWGIVGWSMFLLTLSVLVPQAQATTVLPLTEYKIVDMSTLMIRGVVEQKRSVWVNNKRTIVTLVTLKVTQEVLGRKSPTHITIRHFGGEIGKIRVILPSTPRFVVGKEYLVAAQSSPYLPKNEYLMVGWTQGLWSVHMPELRQSTLKKLEPMVRQNLRGVRFYDPRAKHFHAPQKLKQYETLRGLVTRLKGHWTKIKTARRITKIPLKPAKPKLIMPKKPALLKLAPSRKPQVQPQPRR